MKKSSNLNFAAAVEKFAATQIARIDEKQHESSRNLERLYKIRDSLEGGASAADVEKLDNWLISLRNNGSADINDAFDMDRLKHLSAEDREFLSKL